MSGIFGLVRFDGLPVEEAQVATLTGTAPVADGAHRQLLDGAALGGPASGSTARNHHFWLVADARIDNRDELLPELRTHGLPLAGDAELILAAWLRWGDSCLDRLVGDFAFALWDARFRRLVCARDPLGVKPLCFARAGSGLFSFASEAQRILLLPEISRRLDTVTLLEYLAGLPQSPRRSFFHAIERLPPGHRLTADSAGLRLDRWWNPQALAQEIPHSEGECAAQFFDLFRRAVADRLRTSAPVVGVSLSGGLDSSSIAAAARAQTVAGGPSLLGTTFVFDQLRECDERAHVQSLASEIDLEVAWIPAEKHWLLSDVDTCSPELESPFVGWQATHRQALELLRERGGRVLLTGHGADDLLRGSSRIYADRLCRGDVGAIRDVLRSAAGGDAWRSVYKYLARPLLPPAADRALRRLTGRTVESRLPVWISPELMRRTGLSGRLAALEMRGRWGSMAPAEIRRVALDCAGFEPIVHWHERHARALDIDVRHPYLDRRLFEYVLSLPAERLFKLGSTKPLLRQAVAGVLPETLRLRRDKTTFDRFLVFSLEKEAGRIEEILRAPLVAEWGLVNPSRLRAAFAALRGGTFSGVRRTFWYALTLESWLRHHHGLFDHERHSGENRLLSAA